MISAFLQMRIENRRGQFSRAIAGICVVLWLTGSVSTLYGSLTQQWTAPHCPQTHSNSAHHTHGSCAWHCDGIDTPSSSVRSWRPSITPTGFLSVHLSATLHNSILNGGTTTRGPPLFESFWQAAEKLSLGSNPAVFLRVALTHEQLAGCSKRPSIKAVASEETRRYGPHFVGPFALTIGLGERKRPSSTSDSRRLSLSF